MKPIALATHDLDAYFEPRYLERGRDYWRRGMVASRKVSNDGEAIIVNGAVNGSRSRPYQVYVQLRLGAYGATAIEGDCSCPVGFNCKHVAAVLLDLIAAQTPAPAVARRPDLGEWVDRLSQATAPDPPETTAANTDCYPEDVRERLLYVLAPVSDGRARSRVAVSLQVGTTLTGGAYSGCYRFSMQRAWEPYPPQYLLRQDLQILRRLATRQSVPTGLDSSTGELALLGADGDQLLETMLGTGRCHWLHPQNPVLKAGPPRAARLAWAMGRDGRQTLQFHAEPEIDAVMALAPPWYLDFGQFCCGRIQTGFAPATAAILAEAPAVAPELAAAVGQHLRDAVPDQDIPVPTVVAIRHVPPARPRPVITLTRTQADEVPGASDSASAGLPALRLDFEYAEYRVEGGAGDETAWVQCGTELACVRRDLVAERAAAQRLRTLGLRPWDERLKTPRHDGNLGCWVPFGLQARADWWYEFQGSRALTRMRAEGWRVEISESFPFRIVIAGPCTSHLSSVERRDWFDLALDVDVDGESLPLLPLLSDWLEQLPTGVSARGALARLDPGEPVLVALADGRKLAMDAARVAAVLETLIELYDPGRLDRRGTMRVSRWQLPQIVDLPATPAAGTDSGAVLALGQRLKNFRDIQPATVPAWFRARLRPYQQHGLDWLQFLREYELAGILADDMGLGKTIQSLAHLAIEKSSGRADRPSLVIAPTSLLFNWRREAAEFAPELNVLVLHGADRHREFARIGDRDLVVTSYALLVRDAEILQSQAFHLLILDEAQNIKNPRAHASRAACSLQARHRLCLSGTPLENHLGELWSLFDFLAPGFLGDERQFRRLYRTPIEKHQDEQRRTSLARRVAPFLLRRLKQEVATDLPPKTEILRSVELEGGQRDLYETVRLALHSKVRATVASKGLQRSHIEVLDALLKLRQICCDPRLPKLALKHTVKQSAKLRLLLDMLPEMIEEGRRILLFSQFATMLGLIEAALIELDISYVKLTGKTRDRETPVNRFQCGEVPLFLISLKAGGTGLNLTAADTVIHYDPWWNPAVEDQASDRAHRIGQQRPVFVYKLITEGTVEEKILALQSSKRELVAALFEGGKRLRWQADDLLDLLCPAAGRQP